MKLADILIQDYEVVYVDKKGSILSESAVRAYKRVGKEVVHKFRCTSGRRKGKIVAVAASCARRKDPKRIRLGRKIARMRKGIRVRKSTITRRTSIHRLVKRLNQRLKVAR